MDQNTVLGTLAGIVASVAIGYMFFRLSQLTKVPKYKLRTDVVFEGITEADGFQINMKATGIAESISCLLRTDLLLWNEGNQPLISSEVSKHKPLEIAMPNGSKIIRASVADVSNYACGFKVKVDRDRSKCRIEFSHLNRRDYAKITLLHTKSSESSEYPSFAGHFVGPGDVSRVPVDAREDIILWIKGLLILTAAFVPDIILNFYWRLRIQMSPIGFDFINEQMMMPPEPIIVVFDLLKAPVMLLALYCIAKACPGKSRSPIPL